MRLNFTNLVSVRCGYATVGSFMCRRASLDPGIELASPTADGCGCVALPTPPLKHWITIEDRDDVSDDCMVISPEFSQT
eukprot:SAG31_NODE_4728_length_3001_cov_2.418677_2_plen_79_part_00